MIEKLIQIYKENECLYDMNHRNYNNKLIKAEALKNILQKMQQYLPNLNLHDVQEKIKAIRKQYATELAFIEEAQAMGNKYESNLWCFEQMEFLRKHIVAAKATGVSNNDFNRCCIQMFQKNFHVCMVVVLKDVHSVIS